MAALISGAIPLGKGDLICGGSSEQGRPNFGAVFFLRGGDRISGADPPRQEGPSQPAKRPARGPATVLGKPPGPSGRSPVVLATDWHGKGAGGRAPKWPK